MNFQKFRLCCCAIMMVIMVLQLAIINCSANRKSTFQIDYENDQFLLDGEPFQYVSGTMHYFRVPREYWQDRFRKMKFGGLNAIQTYVEWSSHEPRPLQYDFKGQNDLVTFLRMAQKEGLYVILRVGPYICAERDMGGFPYWLLKIPDIKLRTSDPKYLEQQDRWLDVLLPKIRPLLYQNGGPILMVQFENEYGSYGCDLNYTTYVRDQFRRLLGDDVVLFTTDGNGDGYLRCGHVPGTLTTSDFGASANVTAAVETLRRHQDFGPFVNSEFYSGWFDYWERPYQTVESKQFATTLDEILKNNGSVNIYVYHGGTNFDLKSSSLVETNFKPTTTTYDFNAPINEAGDLTEKFYAIKNVIEKYFPVKDKGSEVKFTNISEKMELPPVKMTFAGTLFDMMPKDPLKTKYPISFEDADHDYGFMLYQTKIDFHPFNPAILSVPGLRDRAHVFIDHQFAGILSRTQNFLNLSILAHNGSELNLFVENQGRCSYVCFGEKRGIVSNVTINNHLLENWKIYRYFDNWSTVIDALKPKTFDPLKNYRTPSFYIGNFTVPDKPSYPLDSFIRVDGWSKGIAFLNGHNLGRYWPVAGPQITLYAPGVYFNKPNEPNQIVLLELDNSPCWYQKECQMQFVKKHIVNGTYPN